MYAYLEFLERILEQGESKNDRTGTGTLSIFGGQMRFSLEDSFPLVTTKKVIVNSFVHELLWMINGDTNIKYLKDNQVNIWNEWADEDGNLGPTYGKQWRQFGIGQDCESVDQLSGLIHQIKTNPDSRRHILTAWNPQEVPHTQLPPCHIMCQFYVNNGMLSAQLYQRSADFFLGVPFNIAEYSLLTCMIAQVCGLSPKEFVWTGGDIHLYQNHLEQARMQLERTPFALAQLQLNPDVTNLFDFTANDIDFVGYESHPFIKGVVSV